MLVLFAATSMVTAADMMHLADAMAELDSTNATERTFDLTCLITAKPSPEPDRTEQTVHMKEANTFGYALCPPAPTVHPGDVVRIRGQAVAAFHGGKLLVARSCKIVGNAPVPAPVRVQIRDILSGNTDNQKVTVSGFVVDIVRDDVDARYEFLVLKSGRDMVKVSHGNFIPNSVLNAEALIGAEVEVTGLCNPSVSGARTFFSRFIGLEAARDIRVLTPPPTSPEDVKPLERRMSTVAEHDSGLRRVRGEVLATWERGHLLLASTDSPSRCITVRLCESCALPAAGADVTVVGYPDTDLFNVTLNNARLRVDSPPPQHSSDTPEITNAAQLFEYPAGQGRYNAYCHGLLARLIGQAHGLPSADGRFTLECGQHMVLIDASSNRQALDGLVNGCTAEVTGICFLDAESQLTNIAFPRVRGLHVIPRKADDIRLVANPPWWTPGRFVCAIAALVGLLVAVMLWVYALNRMVERRSRELMREQIAHRNAESRREDRTRLAVELHDSLSQNLAAVAFQISSAKGVQSTDPTRATERLGTAEKMLDSCRSELRNCLGDLRSNALEQRDFEQAVRQTVDRVRCDAEVRVSFPIARTRLSDSVAHAILMILRELVSNAVRHGQARQIDIRGELAGETLSFCVSDDGHGFDTGKRPGIREGHFGVEGIRQRTKRLNGTFALESAPDAGTKATLTIPIGDCAS